MQFTQNIDGSATCSSRERVSELDPHRERQASALVGTINELARQPGRHGMGHLKLESAPHRHLVDVIAETDEPFDLEAVVNHLHWLPKHLGPPALASEAADRIRQLRALAGIEVPEVPEPPAPLDHQALEERRRQRLAEIVDGYDTGTGGPVVDPLQQLRSIRQNRPSEVGTS
jgi:hypothetical protein